MQRKNNNRTEKKISGINLKIGIAVAEFNWDITRNMLNGAINFLKNNQVKNENIKIIKVPGSFEIPLICQTMAEFKKFDALIALSCIIKGKTDHYHYIANETSKGIMDVMLKYSLPIGFGVITTNNLKQAQERSDGKNNKGREATQAVLEMIKIINKNFKNEKSK